MAYRTVEEAFAEFASRLTPTATESEAVQRHRQSIRDCLDSNFGIVHFFRTGSFGNGTSIKGHSDVDYFAALEREKLKQNSATTLAVVRGALETRFPNTGVHVDSPAVVVPFGTTAAERTEVVPADYLKTTDAGYRVYDMPDCSEGWMNASPDAHNAYVRKVDEALGNKVKPLVRLIKAWRCYRNVPISSFYLELRTAKYASGENSIVYSIDVTRLLKQLQASQLAKMQDPQGVSGYIDPCKSKTEETDALSKLDTAVTRAEKAREAETAGKIEDAFSWWNLLFDGNFPSYRK